MSDLASGIGPISFGCWRFAGNTLADAEALISTSLEVGFSLIDTADIYGFDGTSGFGEAEELLGRVLAAQPGLRDQMVLATKGGIRPGVPYDWSPEYLRQACEDSLRRLGVDAVDLYQLHRPDVLTPPEAVAEALVDLIDRNLVGALGVSNVTPSQFSLLQHALAECRPGLSLVSTQPEFSVWHSDPVRDGTFDQCLELGTLALAWSPLGGGRIGADDDPVVAALTRVGERHGVDAPTVALAFVLAHPARPVPILGTQRVERIRAAAVALDVRLERSDWYELYQSGTGERLP